MESCNFTNKANSHTPKEEIHTRPKLCHFGLYVVLATLFCLKSFVPVTGLECWYGKIFIPVTEISVAKTEISVTGPAPPLIWIHRNFYKEKSGEARSRKPSQPGWPGSYEVFQVLDWTNIRGIGLNQYFKYWIEPIFEVLDWINISSIGLNHENKKIELNQKFYLRLDWMQFYSLNRTII